MTPPIQPQSQFPSRAQRRGLMVRSGLIAAPIVGILATVVPMLWSGHADPLGMTIEFFFIWSFLGFLAGVAWGASMVGRMWMGERSAAERIIDARNGFFGSVVTVTFILAIPFLRRYVGSSTQGGDPELTYLAVGFGLMGLYDGAKLLLELRRQRRTAAWSEGIASPAATGSNATIPEEHADE